jgi:hypothetical protein
LISELPLAALGYLIPAAQKWEQEELKAETEKRLFPLWLTERALHQLAGGSKSDFIKYSDYLDKAFGNGAERTERSHTATVKPRTSEDIISEFMPVIEADRGRNRG